MFSSGKNLQRPNKLKRIWDGMTFRYAIIPDIAGGLETAKAILIVSISPLVLLILLMCYTIMMELIKEDLK